jgi:hypothetical protein
MVKQHMLEAGEAGVKELLLEACHSAKQHSADLMIYDVCHYYGGIATRLMSKNLCQISPP